MNVRKEMVGSGASDRSKEAVGMMALHEALRTVCLNVVFPSSMTWPNVLSPPSVKLALDLGCYGHSILLNAVVTQNIKVRNPEVEQSRSEAEASSMGFLPRKPYTTVDYGWLIGVHSGCSFQEYDRRQGHVICRAR